MLTIECRPTPSLCAHEEKLVSIRYGIVLSQLVFSPLGNDNDKALKNRNLARYFQNPIVLTGKNIVVLLPHEENGVGEGGATFLVRSIFWSLTLKFHF